MCSVTTIEGNVQVHAKSGVTWVVAEVFSLQVEGCHNYDTIIKQMTLMTKCAVTKAQAFGPWPLTAETGVRICGEPRGSETVFFLPPPRINQNFPRHYSSNHTPIN